MSTILLDTNDYLDDYDFMMDEMNCILKRKVSKPRGNVVQWVLLSQRSSHYGSICNNGATGYLDFKTKNLANEIMNVNTDRIVVIDNNGFLQIEFHDHDGTHICEVKPISKSRANYYNSTLEYKPFDKKIEYIKNLPSLKIKK